MRMVLWWVTLLAILVLPGPGSAAATVMRTPLVSGGALVQWCCEAVTDIGGFVFVGQTGSAEEPDGFLFYVLIQRGSLIEGGFGTIPKTHVQGSPFGSLSVRTDTSVPMPGFTLFAGSGGIISVDVKKTGGFTRRITGIQHFTFGGVRMHMDGTETNAAATGSGFVVLTTIGGLSAAEWSTNRQTMLEIIVGGP